jgi:hypothetical protein
MKKSVMYWRRAGSLAAALCDGRAEVQCQLRGQDAHPDQRPRTLGGPGHGEQTRTSSELPSSEQSCENGGEPGKHQLVIEDQDE